MGFFATGIKAIFLFYCFWKYNVATAHIKFPISTPWYISLIDVKYECWWQLSNLRHTTIALGLYSLTCSHMGKSTWRLTTICRVQGIKTKYIHLLIKRWCFIKELVLINVYICNCTLDNRLLVESQCIIT